MSVTLKRRVRCPHCGDEFGADLYWSLHATRSPAVRDAVLAQRFQRFSCPSCDGTVVAEPTLLYTDFHRRQWFATFPARALAHRTELIRLVQEGFHFNMRVNAPPLVRDWADDMRVRVVFGLPWLREKLLLHDAGYDDRLVEVLKLQLLRGTATRLFRPDTPIVVDEVDDDGLTLSLMEAVPDDRNEVVRSYRLPRAAYDALIDQREAMEALLPEVFTSPVVDWRAPFAPHAPLPPGPTRAQQALIERLYTGAP